jgi:hypothetical protein
MKKGQPARVDYEYERNGTANMFMMLAPLEGWQHVKVTERRTAIDYAHALKELASMAPGNSLWSRTTSTPMRRRRSVKPFRLRKRGAWWSASNGTTPRNTAVLDLPNPNSASWPRNASTAVSRTIRHSSRKSRRRSMTHHDAKADWRFTTEKARVKPKHLYPSLSVNRATNGSVGCRLAW